jgi:DNA-binding Xre family transcriptional regulator
MCAGAFAGARLGLSERTEEFFECGTLRALCDALEVPLGNVIRFGGRNLPLDGSK